MNLALAVLVDGVVYSSWLFLIAAGLTLIYGVMKILNMAHGSFYAIGAYSGASLIGVYFAGGNPPWASYLLLIGVALVAGLIVGLLIERGFLQFMYGRDEVVMILVTYGILLILEDTIKLLWGVDPYFAYQPYTLLGRTKIAGLSFANYDFMLVTVTALIALALWWSLNKTQNGKILQSVIHDREIAGALGVNVTKIFTITFVIGAFLGAFAGALTAPGISVVPGIGIEVIILAFAVVVIGGLGSVGGAFAGALIVGISRALSVHLYPDVELFVIYGVMGLVLAFRPQGLFAIATARKI
ncbi:branched-chain amino acid ABC transporter permease [Terasakiella sp. A23]|uniref:branched-chain amino acid ABC transporter permease n=1 Tax=Terasakiella sp. FCG-A23 TaxID=3080561 RepID=UPI0029529836|nr:branched-chain amino acid ABC transporter permease [Terasakiella sp. A23]MDV7341227.1 branched-chain amino acid ABC transporter permease [Terasakiella sp. A23]